MNNHLIRKKIDMYFSVTRLYFTHYVQIFQRFKIIKMSKNEVPSKNKLKFDHLITPSNNIYI